MRTIYLLLLLFITSSCSSDPVTKQFKIFAKRVPKGLVNGRIVCKNDMEQSYALYLPSGYNPEVKYPVIYCFDSHGDGLMPVNLLKEQAEKLGIVIVGSNNIKNGLSQEAIFTMIGTMMGDVCTNVNIDTGRVYLLGFSGGARVALSALFQFSGIRGVIACSGSIPASYIPQQTYIVGIGGTEDMNYAEMEEMEKGFSPDSRRHILLTFEGTHHWPPKITIESALLWLSVGEMKDHILPVDQKIIDHFISLQYNDSLNVLEKYNAFGRIATALDGLSDVSLYAQKRKKMESNPDLKNELTKVARFDSQEKASQELYGLAFNIKTIDWWTNEIARLHKEPKTDDIARIRVLNKRLLAYISLAAYSATNTAQKAGDLKSMFRYLQIYGLADPENPDYYFFLASYYARSGLKEQTVKALEKAIQFGFSDMQKIRGDKIFSTLLDEEVFQQLDKIQKK